MRGGDDDGRAGSDFRGEDAAETLDEGADVASGKQRQPPGQHHMVAREWLPRRGTHVTYLTRVAWRSRGSAYDRGPCFSRRTWEGRRPWWGSSARDASGPNHRSS